MLTVAKQSKDGGLKIDRKHKKKKKTRKEREKGGNKKNSRTGPSERNQEYKTNKKTTVQVLV